MDFPSLSSVEAGGVDLLEFQWPWPPHDEATEVTTCICYVVMKRDDGFVLCVPQDFLPEEVVQEGLENDSQEGPGPSLALVAPAVLLSEDPRAGASDDHRSARLFLRSPGGPQPRQLHRHDLCHREPGALSFGDRRAETGRGLGRRTARRGKVRLPNSRGAPAWAPGLEGGLEGEKGNSGINSSGPGGAEGNAPGVVGPVRLLQVSRHHPP